MSYANGTTHYNLPQTLGTDKRDWFDTNQAFADIDAAIYGAVQNASQAVTDLSALTTRVGAAENDIDTLETAIGTHTSQISAMQTSITQIGNAVTDNKQDVLDMIESTQEASATATYAHAVDSYFIYNDTLYVTTVAIAAGDTIVPNTNCETTDIGTVLGQLNTALAGIDASDVDYDNTNSGLSATDVQGAVDEINSALIDIKSTTVTATCNNGTTNKWYGTADLPSGVDGSKVIGLVALNGGADNVCDVKLLGGGVACTYGGVNTGFAMNVRVTYID